MGTEADTIRDLTLANHQQQALSPHSFVVVPEGHHLEDLEDFQPRPNAITVDHVFRDTRSLAAYLERFERPESIAFSKPDTFAIKVQVDHHQHDQGDEGASHCQHAATFKARFTPQYGAWRQISGVPMSQVKAGLFLEERAVDVIEPDSASIMDMVMTFDALKKVTFAQSTRLHDGRRQFTYSEENEARGQVTLPEQIKLRLPIFEGQEPDVLKIRVRYRIEDGSLRFTFEIADQQEVEMMAFERCEDALRAERKDLLLLRSS